MSKTANDKTNDINNMADAAHPNSIHNAHLSLNANVVAAQMLCDTIIH